MAEYLIQDTTLTNLGDKIRVLSGSEETMTPAVMASELDAVAEKMDSALFVNEITGVTAQMPSPAAWCSITYGNGRFVAVAYDSVTAVYSDDGINWTATTLPSSVNGRSVTYGNGKFVAVAFNSTTAVYSDDGVNWTAATLPSSAKWISVTYGNGRFVAVAQSSTKAAYSEDGINWTAATLPSSVRWHAVTYGNGRFVAVTSLSNKAAYSDDGINWTPATLPGSANWETVTYGNGRFVALEPNKAAYSDDGINWTPATLPESTDWESVTYGNGRFVAVTYNSTLAAYSDDGISWTEATLPSSSPWHFVAYGNGKFVVVTQSSTTAAYSDDGINWTDKTPDQTIIVNNASTDVTDETIQRVMPLDTELSTQDDLIAQITTALETKSSVSYPTLSNPGTAEDLMSGKQLIDGSGNVVTGTASGGAEYAVVNIAQNTGTSYGRYAQAYHYLGRVTHAFGCPNSTGSDYSSKLCGFAGPYAYMMTSSGSLQAMTYNLYYYTDYVEFRKNNGAMRAVFINDPNASAITTSN